MQLKVVAFALAERRPLVQERPVQQVHPACIDLDCIIVRHWMRALIHPSVEMSG
jgi:hypothetical protein